MLQFSVIIPFHNAETTLSETLDSLRSQTETEWEVLLINDASTDGSVALAVNAVDKDSRFQLINDLRQGTPRGVAATRNLGISAARGKYVALLDADDRWLPEKMALQRRAFENGADIVFSSYRRFNPEGQSLGKVVARPTVAWKDAIAGNPIGCLTGAWRRERFPEARMPNRNLHEDYVFWMTLLRDGSIAHGLPQVLAEYRVQPGSISANKWRAALAVWEILGEENLSWRCRGIGFLRYAFKAVARRL
jgi:teichuronic acid biosynthesis glycosyltransferase TuaG